MFEMNASNIFFYTFCYMLVPLFLRLKNGKTEAWKAFLIAFINSVVVCAFFSWIATATLEAPRFSLEFSYAAGKLFLPSLFYFIINCLILSEKQSSI